MSFKKATLLSLATSFLVVPMCFASDTANSSSQLSSYPSRKITTFLMFYGKAEEAINFYTSVFENSRILSMVKYGAKSPGIRGTVEQAHFSLNGEEFMATDSPPVHDFGFTPAISLFVKCDSDRELQDLYDKLSTGGKIHMPLDKYPFSEKFCFLTDKYGVSWQLSKGPAGETASAQAVSLEKCPRCQ